MAIELSSAGVSVQYAVETTAGTRPTSGYKKITGIKSTPDLNPEASSLDVTDLSDTEWKRYIGGLKDPGGALAFGANNTEDFQTDWSGLVEEYNTAKATGLGMWFAIVIPGLTKSFYMSVEPQPLGLSAIEVDSVLEIEAYASPKKIDGWLTKPTGM
jgi:hypothetical protein